jgi:hypothetical protein
LSVWIGRRKLEERESQYRLMKPRFTCTVYEYIIVLDNAGDLVSAWP